MVKYTRDLLKFYGGSALVNKMDLRLGLIPRYPGLKIFNSGLADLALFIASEYKHMMKVMPYVLEGLFLDEKKDELLVQMFVNWNTMYCQSRQNKFTQTDLSHFEITRTLIHKEVYECIVLQNNQPKINTGKFGKQYAPYHCSI
ncbi:hypothetical protein C2G38_2311348, partial [Gigaspora rosea]